MPWTVKDVDKHKKGLSSEQKKKWVKVANGTLRDCLENGGSQKSCEAKAIRVANSKFSEEGGDSMKFKGNGPNITVPKGALQFFDRENTEVKFAESDGKPRASILAYSGKPFRHFWWGNFAINLDGLKPAKSKLPLLRDHRTDLEIGFFSKPKIDHSGINVEPESVTLLENEEAGKFVQNSKAGFPYEASVYVIPTKIRRVDEKEEVEVNGHKLRGPGTIFEETVLKEVSVCVFGYDSNTKSAAMSDGEDSVTLSVEGLNIDNDEEVNEIMKLSELKKNDPEGYAQLVEDAKSSVEGEYKTQLSEKDDAIMKLEQDNAKLTESNTKLEETNMDVAKRLTKLEERDREREIKASAENIIASAFSESDLTDPTKAKIKKFLDHKHFVKEDGLDTEAFSKFVKDELKDWETTLNAEDNEGTFQGSGQGNRQIEEGTSLQEDEEAEEFVDRMLSSIGQNTQDGK